MNRRRPHGLTPRLGPLVALTALACRAAAEGTGPPAPSALAVAADGALIVADLHRPGLFRRPKDGPLGRFAEGGPKQRTPLHAVSALAVGRDGAVFAGDRATGEVYRVRPGAPPEPLTGGALEIPTGLAVDARGDLIACDLRLGTVVRIPAGGGPPVTLARVAAPRGVALGNSGGIVVLSMGPDQVVRVGPDGAVKAVVKGKPFAFPAALLWDGARARFLVSDSYAATVWSVDDTGAARPWLRGEPLVRPEGLALDPSGAVLVADPGASRVFRVTAPDRIEALALPPR